MIEPKAVSDPLRIRLDRVERNALIVGAIALVLAVIGALVDLNQALQSYLFSYLFWLGITLGCLAWLLIHGVTGGRWGDAVHPLLEASAWLVVLMAILFVPLLFGLNHLYLWAQPDVVAADALLQHKQPYLNVPFFIGRAVLYFVVWAGTILLLNRWWRQLTQQPTLELAERLRRFSGIGLALYGLTMSFGAIDWLMSLDPHWYSTIFGVLVASGQVCAALAFIIAVVAYLGNLSPFSQIVSEGRVMDLGSLLLTAVIFWTYIAFAQFFIIWSGNLPEEVVWYLDRLDGGWNWIAIIIFFLHVIIPFFLLLSNDVKRNPRRLAVVAVLILVAELLNLYWMVEPAFSGQQFSVHWLDFVMPVLIGGIWITAFSWRLRRQMPLVVESSVGDSGEAA